MFVQNEFSTPVSNCTCRNVKEEELLAQTGKKIIVTKDRFVTDE